MTNGNIGGAGGTGAGAGIITFNAQSGTLRNVAQINGGATFNKTTVGTLILDTANNYTGATTVTAGVLAISHGGALGGTTNGTSVAAGGTLAMSGNITVTGESLSLAAGAGGNATLSNQSGANTWTGNLTVDTGSDAANRALLNSDAGKLTVSGNVNLSSGTQDFVLRGDGNGEISGQITGSQRLFKSSVGTGTWILSGDNSATFTGKTSVSNGAIQVASESNLGATPGSFVANQLTLGGGSTNGKLKTTASMALSANRGVTIGAGGGTFDTADATTLTVNGVVTGGGTIAKEGTGTLLLNAVNTNTGTTTVNAGTLGGTGTVGGDLIVASGGTLAPGVGGAGQLTLTGALSLNTGGSLLMELGGVTYNDADTVRAYFNTNGNLSGLTVLGAYENYQVGATQHDSLLINGSSAPVINGTFKFGSLINGYTPHYGDIFDLIDWTAAGNIAGTPTFDFSSVSLTGLAFNTDLFASNGIVVVVPEPSRVLFLMLGLLGLMLRRRRW
jgi:autotransporter-associated beta strand protein